MGQLKYKTGGAFVPFAESGGGSSVDYFLNVSPWTAVNLLPGAPTATRTAVQEGMTVSGYVAAAYKDFAVSDFALTCVFASTLSPGVPQIVFRYIDANNWLSWTPNNGGPGRFRERIAGVSHDTALANVGVYPLDVFEVVASGTSIEFKKNGVAVDSAVSSAHLTATKHGPSNASAGGAITWRSIAVTPL